MSVFWFVVRLIMWPVGLLLAAFVLLFLIELARTPGRTKQAIEEIRAAKITMQHVDGSNLPPTPDSKLVDATVEGIDANDNGIRDDVELAIFKKYPNDKKLRAAALQYAMTEQMFLTHVSNTETWKAVAEEAGRAGACIKASSSTRITVIQDEIDILIFSTPARQKKFDEAYEFITSHGNAPGQACDIQ